MMRITSIEINGIVRERWDDATRTVTTYDETGAATNTRPYAEAENAAADDAAAAAATLTDLAARVARIEAHLWPAPDDPTDPADETVGEFDGVWPDQGLIREDGTIWRNVSGVPLTTPPSGFPGTPSAWERLFVAVISEPTEPTVAAWVRPLGAHDAYSFGNQVTFNGHLWKSNVAGERTNTWKPGVYGWDDLGPI